jgi:hypothetical protein
MLVKQRRCYVPDTKNSLESFLHPIRSLTSTVSQLGPTNEHICLALPQLAQTHDISEDVGIKIRDSYLKLFGRIEA